MRRRNRKRLISTVAGAAGGLLASFAMTRFQAAWTAVENKIAPSKDDPQKEGDDATVKTAKGIARTVFSHELTEPEKKWAGPAVHYAFGCLSGAFYGALAAEMPVATAGGGVAFGSALWVAADEIGVPVAGLSDAPIRIPPKVHLQAWAAHIVYGAVTDLTRRAALKAFRVR